MATWWHNDPLAESYQQNAYNGFPYLPEYGHRRSAPREEPFVHWRAHGRGGRGWYQGGRKLHDFESKKYWARPIDGARRGTLGRVKDALSGEGPDVFVVSNGDKRTFSRDLPSRNHWSHWDGTGQSWARNPNWKGAAEDMDWFPSVNIGSTRWAKRDNNEVYNFRTREYDHIGQRNKWNFWSDATYSNNKRAKWSVPTNWRDWDGFWHTTVDGSAGRWPGGRPLR